MSAPANHNNTQPVQSPLNTDPGVILNELPTFVGSSAAKRKYEQAVQLLDDVTGACLVSDGPPTPKRVKTNTYATLAKYRIGTSTISRSGTPLASIIQRTKTHSPLDEGVYTNLPNTLVKGYDPHSRKDFLTRLHTYKLVTYGSKPSEIDSVAASRNGWHNEGGKESLHCHTCGVSWVMPANESDSTFCWTVCRNESSTDLWNSEESWVKVQAKALVERHETSCPWRLRQCEASIYSMPIPSPLALSKGVYHRAERIAGALDGMEITHPLTTDQSQAILSAVASARAAMSHPFHCPERGNEMPLGQAIEVSSAPSETSCILAFLGWDMTPPSTAINTHQMSSPLRGLLTCSLCQRQVPTWNFFSPAILSRSLDSSGSRQHQTRAFDVLREHRTHCPYVVKATPSPSLAPMSIPNTHNAERDVQDMALSPSMVLLEGWRVHLNILLRSEWRRTSEYASLGRIQGSPVGELGENPVGGIIETVRTRHGGGRDLLRFVKGLLG